MKLGAVRDLVDGARKGFTKKVHEALVPRLTGHLREITVDIPPLACQGSGIAQKNILKDDQSFVILNLNQDRIVQ